jgi:hypothetical protein
MRAEEEQNEPGTQEDPFQGLQEARKRIREQK